MPVGIELDALQYQEGLLISMAYAYEQHSIKRMQPMLPKKTHVFDDWDIARFNNYINQLGEVSYQQVLIHSNGSHSAVDLMTPDTFKQIINETKAD